MSAPDSPGQCTALNISDEKPCQEVATSRNGLFCTLHSRQCQGLYLGYKRRNAELDRLSLSPPAYLADSETPLINELFAGVKTEEQCKEIHDYLFKKLQLLERVIRARKLHHSRFFSQNYDYGHVNYLNQLHNQRGATTKALERIERRTAEILYHNQKWFKWVRKAQDEEEAKREKEQKKVKMEAAMFRRHWKEVQQRLEELRIKEWHKKQDAALEQAYKESLSADEDDGSDWDPIDDVVEDERENFIDLIKRFLWMSMDSKDGVNQNDAPNDDVDNTSKDMADLDVSSDVDEKEESAAGPKTNGTKSNGKKSKKSKAKKKKPQKSKSSAAKATDQKPSQDTESGPIETREQMYNRLRHGREYNEAQRPGEPAILGVMVGGTKDNPEIDSRTARYPEEKVQKLLAEIAEIKHLLFCRLLLGHATLLPAALRAESVEAFLADPEVTETALRDVCLKMENPGTQVIRDACADLFRENEDDNPEVEPERLSEESSEEEEDMFWEPGQPKDAIPNKWVSAREKQLERAGIDDEDNFRELLFAVGNSGGVLDFGEIKENNHRTKKMVRVKICGRVLWYYPSSKAMSRRGWLHFCIIAKDSSLHEAISLCRTWEEFYDLNILAMWDYFPSITWAKWGPLVQDQQLKTLGFVIYSENQPDADIQMRSFAEKIRRSGIHGAKLEVRNWMCAYIKRNDPASRRFLQYLAMHSECFLLVRDGETGKIIVKPPEEERWLMRGSATKVPYGNKKRQGKWDILQEIGPEFFEEMDKFRKWDFTFKDHYDVYVWNVQVGEPYAVLYNIIFNSLIKAHRCRNGYDISGLASHVLKEITWADENKRIRDVEPGEKSVWDYYHDEGARFVIGKYNPERNPAKQEQEPKHIATPKALFYNEADVLEDEVLFPEDYEGKGKIATSRIFEDEGVTFQRFLDHMVDSDSEFDSSDEDEDSEWTTDSDDPDDLNQKGQGSLDKLLSKKDPASLRELLSQRPSREMMETFQLKHQAAIFKEAWHNADLEPDARQRYIESIRMGKAARRHTARLGPFCSASVLGFSVCKWIDPIRTLDDSPQDQKDIMKAMEKLGPYFFPSFRKSKEGRKYKDSLLLNQDKRAKEFSVWRCSKSFNEHPEGFWDEWNKVQKEIKSVDDLPLEWDKAVRPLIAKLWKAGVIRTKRDDWEVIAQAIGARDPVTGRMEMFFDYQHVIEGSVLDPRQVNPATIPALLPTARQFAKKNPKARFALLRIWSAPHFYPLMLGPENRRGLAFQDCTGRDWLWMFVPKDMPYSEYSIHMNASQRILQFRPLFGEKVVCKKDTYLCMGEDEQELAKIATAVTWLVQRRPWRLEIDLWKSFVNVDLKLLEKLPEQYWTG